jgi:hypothetical protein
MASGTVFVAPAARAVINWSGFGLVSNAADNFATPGVSSVIKDGNLRLLIDEQ